MLRTRSMGALAVFALAISVLAAVAVACGSSGGGSQSASPSSEPTTLSIHGTAVMDYNVAFGGGAKHECARFPYEKHDIQEVAAHSSLQVMDESNTLIATGSLDRTADSDCKVAYTITDVPKANFYTVVIDVNVPAPIPGLSTIQAASGTFKTDPYSFDEMESKDWMVELVLPSVSS